MRPPPALGSPGRQAALVRVGAGLVMLARPPSVGQVLGSREPAAAWAVRMLGAREVALGLAVLGSGTPSSLLAGAGSDAVDALVLGTALRRGELGRTRLTRALAGACTAGAVTATAVQLREAIRTIRTSRVRTTALGAPRD
ncbi:MAG: hypothetical protein JWM64_470 [Frankiales bacterium]|nr:hypothetical protein [Frankiales bacterium]